MCDLLKIEHPIIQAPMAGASSPEMAAAAANAGALGSLGCALQPLDQVKANVDAVRAGTNRSVNFNFFVHAKPQHDPDRSTAAIERLKPWYDLLGLGSPTPPAETHPRSTQTCVNWF